MELFVTAKHPTENIGYASMVVLDGREEICKILGIEYSEENFEAEKTISADELKELQTDDINLSMFVTDVFNGMAEPVEEILLTVKHQPLEFLKPLTSDTEENSND